MEKKVEDNEVNKDGDLENPEQLNNGDYIEKVENDNMQDVQLNNADNFNQGDGNGVLRTGNDSKNKRHNEKYLNYPERMLEEINRIRKDPLNYANEIINAENKILDTEDPNDKGKYKKIYKDKIKVALFSGKEAFEHAADCLRMMDGLEPLEMKEDLLIPIPEEEDKIHDPHYLKEQVKLKRDNNINIDIFFKDLIKRPEVSALLMVVDDSSKNPGRKRDAIMNKDFKYIGISSHFVGNTFVAYFAFSK